MINEIGCLSISSQKKGGKLKGLNQNLLAYLRVRLVTGNFNLSELFVDT